MEKTMEKIVALAKARGFVYPGSEIYGGLANTWDYGNLGVELKNNVKRAWWQKFVQESPYNVGVDCAILMNPQTWVASGHLGGFSDPLMDCKECHERFRADKLIEDFCAEHDIAIEGSVDAWSQEQMMNFIKEHEVPCPSCGKHNFTDIRQFNLMFKTFQGVTEDAKNTVYLRPETAQGIFVNFKNVQRTSRKKIPFGIGQIGKSFRNEITPGNFTFRTREFEQMELEFFCEPDTDLEWFAYWKKFCLDWLSSLGLKDDEVRYRDHDKEELSFYSKATTDVEFLFPFGWGELWGIADRTDYDLTQHQNVSGQDLTYFDDETKEKYIPNSYGGRHQVQSTGFGSGYGRSRAGGNTAPAGAGTSTLAGAPGAAPKKPEVKKTVSYAPGDIVDHRVFGRGKVLKATPIAGDCIVEIQFDRVGVKKTMANYAPLKKVEE